MTFHLSKLAGSHAPAIDQAAPPRVSLVALCAPTALPLPVGAQPLSDFDADRYADLAEDARQSDDAELEDDDA